MITLYGIPNCDTVRKARRWLDQHQISYVFHDFRKDGLKADLLEGWLKQFDWEQLINRRGTTWRQLDAETRESIDKINVVSLLQKYPAMIRRPVLDVDGRVNIGFEEQTYKEQFT